MSAAKCPPTGLSRPFAPRSGNARIHPKWLPVTVIPAMRRMTMSRDRSPLRTLRSRIAGITLALLIIFTGVPLSSSALARQADEDPPVDLAAMVLRPSDLEAEGVELMGEARYNRD